MDTTDKYILMDKEVHPVYDLIAWGRWMQDHSRRIERTRVGDIIISTVFLGLDHSHGNRPPILFETMCFRDKNRNPKSGVAMDDCMERYATYDEAIIGHNKMVEFIGGSNVVSLNRG